MLSCQCIQRLKKLFAALCSVQFYCDIGSPDFLEVAKRMNPPIIMTKMVVEFIRRGKQYSIYGPIIKFAQNKVVIITASS
jgi:hypothetical protein